MNYLRHMSVFAKVVESGSISAAAESLNLSKSVVSQHLKVLEDELGVGLLKRTTRRQTLTPAGKDFFEKCQQMNQLATQAWDNARESQITPKGHIHITAPHALMGTIVAPAVGKLVAQYPEIQPTLSANDQRVDLLQTGIDLAVRVGESPTSNLKQRRIGQFRDVLCCAPHFKIEKNTAFEKCLYVANGWQKQKIIHHFERISQNTAIPESVLTIFSATRFTDSIHTTLALIESGAGVGIVPEFIFREAAKKGTLKSAMVGYQLPQVAVYTMHAFNQTPPLLVKLCSDAIEEALQQQS